jgi:hypothetical protein
VLAARGRALEAERDEWKAKTRAYVVEFLTAHPDERIRKLSDLTGKLEADREALTRRVAELEEALNFVHEAFRRKGHHATCSYALIVQHDCDCGFALLSKLALAASQAPRKDGET